MDAREKVAATKKKMLSDQLKESKKNSPDKQQQPRPGKSNRLQAERRSRELLEINAVSTTTIITTTTTTTITITT